MEIPAKYNSKVTEERWYNYWLENNYFASKPDHRTPYTIVIPPPNVTGVLHMGHMLNNTLQDVLIRRARMFGFNACWVPGTDHASIATEAKVVAKLKEEGINKADISREKFLEHAWDWTHKYGGTILEQLKKLGCSCDWDRTKFTLDDDLSESVIDVFIQLHKKGLIYRGYRMVNWDPEAKTNISDEEVIFKEQAGKLYYINYKIEGTKDTITVATTRPETIFGDTAICINPNDERFTHLKGKNVIVPIVKRSIPIIEDEYVDIEFGTGCLKITPAHDINDKTIGDKHKLEVINVLNDDATLNANGLHYEGKDRFIVRKMVVKELDALGALQKVEEHQNKVGTSERTGAVIEPKISVQWFLNMKELAQPALEIVMNDGIKLYPEKFKNTYKHWMENVHDWNISRQLWWGHQIPAFFYGNGMEDFVVAKTAEEALPLAKEKTGNQELKVTDLKQDADVLDTWFSSWLWPISVFDGIRNPENEEINYYYPTQDLVTAPEILFFWVARMVMAGYAFKGELPFKNVYLTGIVRDKLGRKMSKSLGNSPDPIELMQKYGADGVRVGMLFSSPAGNDLPFDEDLCLQGRNFSNKIWNAFRLVQGWGIDTTLAQPETNKQAIVWFENKLNFVLTQIEDDFEKYRISDALMNTYKLVWDDFCAWYLEIIKPNYEAPIDAETHKKTIELLEQLLKLLHPFMPFLTEEIWQIIEIRTAENALIITQHPKAKPFDQTVLDKFTFTSDIITNLRSLRKEKNISPKEPLELITDKSSENLFLKDIVTKLGNLTSIDFKDAKPEKAFSFLVKTTEFSVPFNESVDTEAEKEKLTVELIYQKGFLESVRKKLSNEKFVTGAPEKVLAMERKKEQDALDIIGFIEISLKGLM